MKTIKNRAMGCILDGIERYLESEKKVKDDRGKCNKPKKVSSKVQRLIRSLGKNKWRVYNKRDRRYNHRY